MRLDTSETKGLVPSLREMHDGDFPQQQSIEGGLGVCGGIFAGVKVLGASSLLEVWYQAQDQSRASRGPLFMVWRGLLAPTAGRP